MRVMVTGGAGFIGSALCRGLIAQGAEVLNLDALTYAGDLTSLGDIAASPRYRFVHGDVCDRRLIDRLLSEFAPDAIAHLAAESHVDRSIEDSAEFIRTNIVGVHTLLQATLAYWERLPSERRDRFRFLHVSTDEVFGQLGETGVFNELSRYEPRSPYAASKAAGDHLARAWRSTYGLPVVVTNCANNYGPYQRPEKFIPLFILNALEGKDLPLYGDGDQVRDWMHVEDHVAALWRVIERGVSGQTYLIGGDAQRRNLDVANAICDLVDQHAPDPALGSRRALVKRVEDRPGHDRRYAVDASKIKRELGWRPSRAFDEGLRETVAWYLGRRDWWEPLRARFPGSRLGARIWPSRPASGADHG